MSDELTREEYQKALNHHFNNGMLFHERHDGDLTAGDESEARLLAHDAALRERAEDNPTLSCASCEQEHGRDDISWFCQFCHAAAGAEAKRLRETLEPIPGVLTALVAWGAVLPGADRSYWGPRCTELVASIRAALGGERRE